MATLRQTLREFDFKIELIFDFNYWYRSTNINEDIKNWLEFFLLRYNIEIIGYSLKLEKMKIHILKI